MGVFTQVTAPASRIGFSVKQPDDMAHHVHQWQALAKLLFDVGVNPVQHCDAAGNFGTRVIENHRVDIMQQVGILVGLAAQHDAIDLL